LSPAALETLAIVAYRQPIVKMEIESIRGVDVSAPLKGLLEKKLIRIVGRKDVPGKPIIYGTTKKFLEVFNLKELADLPTMREMKELTLQQEVYEQEAIDFDDVLQEAPDKESFILDEVRQGEPQTPQKTAETKETINQEPFEPEIIEDETTS
jgi:segregation and condensation protein B